MQFIYFVCLLQLRLIRRVWNALAFWTWYAALLLHAIAVDAMIDCLIRCSHKLAFLDRLRVQSACIWNAASLCYLLAHTAQLSGLCVCEQFVRNDGVVTGAFLGILVGVSGSLDGHCVADVGFCGHFGPSLELSRYISFGTRRGFILRVVCIYMGLFCVRLATIIVQR